MRARRRRNKATFIEQVQLIHGWEEGEGQGGKLIDLEDLKSRLANCFSLEGI
jgi:hypothetical protein